MGVRCEILIQDTKDGVFRPGQYLTGTVKCFMDKPTKFKTIDVSLVGKGTVRELPELGPDKTPYDLQNEEEYVNVSKNLFKAMVDLEVCLSGSFEYPWVFQLPDEIPSSIKNDTGGIIEYKVIVKFVKAKCFRNIRVFTKEIPVYGYASPCSSEPLLVSLQKSIYSLTHNKYINVNALIEKTLITPGENIIVKVTIDNNTDFPISIKAELIQYFTYVFDNKKVSVKSKVVETGKPYSTTIAEKSSSANIICIVQTLPSLYSIQNSKIMIGDFKVRVTAKLPFPHSNAVVEGAVVIGESRPQLGAVAVGYDWNDSSQLPEKVDKNLIDL